MNTTNPFIAFVAELFQRIGQKSPTFFVVLQWISGAVTAVAGIPAFLTSVGATLPEPFLTLESKTVAACAGIALFFSMLPVQGTTQAVNLNNEQLKGTDPKKMPFTASSDAKDDTNHPIVPVKR